MSESCLLRRVQTSAPLRLLIEGPELQVELRLGGLLPAFLHGGQPVARTVEGGADHLKLLQTQLVDELLLHDVQLRRAEAGLKTRGRHGLVYLPAWEEGSSSALRCRAVCPSGGSRTAGDLDSHSAPGIWCVGPPSALSSHFHLQVKQSGSKKQPARVKQLSIC